MPKRRPGREGDLCLQSGAPQQQVAEEVDSVLQYLCLMLDFNAVRGRWQNLEQILKLLGYLFSAPAGVALRQGRGARWRAV